VAFSGYKSREKKSRTVGRRKQRGRASSTRKLKQGGKLGEGET